MNLKPYHLFFFIALIINVFGSSQMLIGYTIGMLTCTLLVKQFKF